MQPYPEHLATHERVQVFDLNDEVFHLYDHLAYFHTKEFPLFMHSHDFYELNIITEGRGRHYIEGNNFAAKPGDVFAVPPHIKHGYWADGDMSIFHLLIGEYMFTKFHKELVQFPGVHLLFEAEPLIRRNIDKVSLFLHLNEEQQRDFLPKMQDIVALAGARYEGANTIFEMRSICLICELAHFIADDYRSKYAGKDVHRESLYSIIPSTEYMNENFANHITLKDLAKRAMLSPAKLLILDEATSNVDTRTELLIRDAMARLMKGRTCFVIAHRLTTVRSADLILVVKGGDIVERGRHEELLQREGFYSEIYEAQFE